MRNAAIVLLFALAGCEYANSSACGSYRAAFVCASDAELLRDVLSIRYAGVR